MAYHLRKSEVVCPKDGYNIVSAYIILLPSGREELRETFCPRCAPGMMIQILRNAAKISDWTKYEPRQRLKIPRY